MTIQRLSHVNIRTTKLTEMSAFYVDVVGLTRGDRPPFSFPGAWLYAGEFPVVHLVEVTREPAVGTELRVQHFAFEGAGLDAFLARLRERNVPHRVGSLAGWGTPQVHVTDPDGNQLHVDFPRPEAVRAESD